jgi:hypothetical protein
MLQKKITFRKGKNYQNQFKGANYHMLVDGKRTEYFIFQSKLVTHIDDNIIAWGPCYLYKFQNYPKKLFAGLFTIEELYKNQTGTLQEAKAILVKYYNENHN